MIHEFQFQFLEYLFLGPARCAADGCSGNGNVPLCNLHGKVSSFSVQGKIFAGLPHNDPIVALRWDQNLLIVDESCTANVGGDQCNGFGPGRKLVDW